MSEEFVISQCSPTMAGLKTGNLFTCPISSRREFTEDLKNYNARLVPKGVRLLPLRVGEKSALVYMYRPDRLKTDLSNSLACGMLKERSYPSGNADRCIVELIKRLKTDKSFPHEIGLFLGYPAEDVDGFVRYGAKNAKSVGTWKVYGNEEEAKKKFALYKKCTGAYKNAYSKHKSFDRLVVSLQK